MFPLRAFYNNIFFASNGNAYALYRFNPLPHRFLSLGHKETAVGWLEELLFGLEGKGQIFLLWEEIALDEGSYLKNADAVSSPFLNEATNHARAVRAAVAKGARKRRYYLVLELSRTRVSSGWREFLAELRDVILRAFLGVGLTLLSAREVKTAVGAEEELYLRLKRFGISRAEFRDVEFVIRKCADRISVLSSPLPDRRAGFFTPGTVAAFTDGVLVEEHLDHVVVRNLGREHYQAFISFVDMPKRMPADGMEVFSPSDLDFPFDVVIHFNIMRPHQALSKVETKRRLLRAQMQEAGETGEEPDVLEDIALADSKLLDAKLEAGQPLIEIAVTQAVASRDLKNLRSRVSQLCQRYSSDRFRAVCPVAKQMDCFFSFLPGWKPASPMVPCDPGFLASMGPHFSSELGDSEGFFLGWSGFSPVFWKPGRPAMELNRTNAILVTGSLGGGKSHLIKYLAYFTILAGGYVLAVDPKGEYHPLAEIFPEASRVLDLSPRRGVAFSPFVLSPDLQRAKAVAVDYLTLALNAGGCEARRVAIGQVVEAMFRLPQERRNMATAAAAFAKLAKEAEHSSVREEASHAAFLLRALQQTDVGRLVFGASTGEVFRPNERVVVVNTRELPRPRAGVPLEQCTESERQGLALLYLVAALAREAAFGLPREIPKMLVYDEAWSLLSIAQGQQLLDEVVRIGRTFNLIPVIAVQNLSDAMIPAIVNNVSQVFCFRASDPEEVELNLKVLGAGPGTVSVKTFSRLEAGTCLFRDAEGRIGWLRVELLPSYLNEVFDTRPGRKVVADRC